MNELELTIQMASELHGAALKLVHFLVLVCLSDEMSFIQYYTAIKFYIDVLRIFFFFFAEVLFWQSR